MPSRKNALERAKARIATQQQTIEAQEQRIRTLEAAATEAQRLRPRQRPVQHVQEQEQVHLPLLAQLTITAQAQGRGPILTRLHTISFICGAIFRLFTLLLLTTLRFALGLKGHTVRERVSLALGVITSSAKKVWSLLVQIGWGVIGAVLWWVANEVLEIRECEVGGDKEQAGG